MSTERLLDEFWSVEELAKELGVTTRTIRRYVDEPDGLPHVTIGRRTRFHKPTVRQWLMDRMKRPNPTRQRAA